MADTTLRMLLIGEDRSASKALKGVGDEAEKAGGKLDGMKVLGAAALAGAATAAVQFGASSVEAFRDAEKSQRLLEDAYQRFPATADLNIEKLRELNSAIQAKTGADADDLAASQATLAQYGLTGQQIADLTPLLDDYAMKTGKDLPSAAEDLGKAMLGQGKALKGVGVDFKDAGSLGANFDQVMGGLRTQVGGFAEGESTSAEGALRKLNTEFGDVQEAVGEQLLPVLVQMGEALLQVVGWVKENIDWLGPLTAGLAGVAGAMLLVNLALNANPISLVVIAIAALVAGLVVAYNTSEDFRNAVDGAFRAVAEAGRWLWNNALAPVIRFIVGGFASVVDGIGDFLLALGNIPGFGWATDAGNKMKGAARDARDLADSIRDIPPSKTVRIGVQVAYTATGSRAVGTSIGVADGGKVSFYAGGGREDHRAQFAKGGTWRVWAEDETEGEWYLPLARSKRDRTIPMWWQAGRDLGVVGFADGGRFGGASVSGGLAGLSVEVNVAGSVVSERDLVSAVRDGLAQGIRRRGGDPSILGV